jgi:hypothetical protein
MVRGLACHITESDIRSDITQHGLVARDIRLIRKKETGTVPDADHHHLTAVSAHLLRCFRYKN